MIDELNEAITGYQEKWQRLVAQCKNKAFFEALKPTAVCLKVADIAELDKCVAALRDAADTVHMAWLNDRWLATVHLRAQKLDWGIEVVKIYQRRPGSQDALGLDHIDFYAPAINEDILADEPGLKWSNEVNGICSWISLWFAGTEAKLRAKTTLAVEAEEMNLLNERILEAK